MLIKKPVNVNYVDLCLGSAFTLGQSSPQINIINIINIYGVFYQHFQNKINIINIFGFFLKKADRMSILP